MLARVTLLALSLLLLRGETAVAPASERDAWHAEVAAARARADQRRALLRAEFERNKILRAREPRLPDYVARARMASDQVFNDLSLQRGDIVSTIDGLFVFNGDEQGVRSRSSFAPVDAAGVERP